MKKILYNIWNFVILIFLIIIIAIFAVFYFIICGINWVIKKIFKKEKDLIPIDKWMDKWFEEENNDY